VPCSRASHARCHLTLVTDGLSPRRYPTRCRRPPLENIVVLRAPPDRYLLRCSNVFQVSQRQGSSLSMRRRPLLLQVRSSSRTECWRLCPEYPRGWKRPGRQARPYGLTRFGSLTASCQELTTPRVLRPVRTRQSPSPWGRMAPRSASAVTASSCRPPRLTGPVLSTFRPRPSRRSAGGQDRDGRSVSSWIMASSRARASREDWLEPSDPSETSKPGARRPPISRGPRCL
jgi:hypothetical protein